MGGEYQRTGLLVAHFSSHGDPRPFRVNPVFVARRPEPRRTSGPEVALVLGAVVFSHWDLVGQ
jgi:hypothetical protein